MKKKLLIITILGLMVLTGCGSKNATQSSTATASNANSSTTTAQATTANASGFHKTAEEIKADLVSGKHKISGKSGDSVVLDSMDDISSISGGGNLEVYKDTVRVHNVKIALSDSCSIPSGFQEGKIFEATITYEKDSNGWVIAYSAVEGVADVVKLEPEDNSGVSADVAIASEASGFRKTADEVKQDMADVKCEIVDQSGACATINSASDIKSLKFTEPLEEETDTIIMRNVQITLNSTCVADAQFNAGGVIATKISYMKEDGEWKLYLSCVE